MVGKRNLSSISCPRVGFVETRPALTEKVAWEVYPREESGPEKARR